MHILHTYRRIYDKPCATDTRVLERSPFSAHAVFMEAMKQRYNHLLSKKYNTICRLYVININNRGCLAMAQVSWLEEEMRRLFHSDEIDHIIYMRTNPSIAFQRMRERGREEETGITQV